MPPKWRVPTRSLCLPQPLQWGPVKTMSCAPFVRPQAFRLMRTAMSILWNWPARLGKAHGMWQVS